MRGVAACERRNEDAPSDELHGPRCHLSKGSGGEGERGIGERRG